MTAVIRPDYSHLCDFPLSPATSGTSDRGRWAYSRALWPAPARAAQYGRRFAGAIAARALADARACVLAVGDDDHAFHPPLIVFRRKFLFSLFDL